MPPEPAGEPEPQAADAEPEQPRIASRPLELRPRRRWFWQRRQADEEEELPAPEAEAPRPPSHVRVLPPPIAPAVDDPWEAAPVIPVADGDEPDMPTGESELEPARREEATGTDGAEPERPHYVPQQPRRRLPSRRRRR